MEDGLILMYVKDDIVYPVALDKKQVDFIKTMQCLFPTPIKVLINQPQGKAIDLKNGGS